ncbi:hypothetical protein Tco_1036434, partial [Tanacetum coccineum]
GCDAVGKAGISALVKCTSAIRQLAYAVVPDSLDGYLQISEKTSHDCLMHFCNGIIELYGEEYLRRPTQTDVEKLYAFHENKHGFPGSELREFVLERPSKSRRVSAVLLVMQVDVWSVPSWIDYLRKWYSTYSREYPLNVWLDPGPSQKLGVDAGDLITSLAVVDPLRKKCYELPPFPLRFDKLMRRESCGLGFDTDTNTWKMVCVLLKEYAPPYKPDLVKKNLCSMVHVFGTNSWREIPQVPDGGREVIWFDVNKEEFGVIERPKIMRPLWRYTWSDHRLVNLNGEVGYVCTMTMEFSLLNHKKEWVPHCRFKQEIVPSGFIKDVIG